MQDVKKFLIFKTSEENNLVILKKTHKFEIHKSCYFLGKCYEQKEMVFYNT